jgi:hypothetical protein
MILLLDVCTEADAMHLFATGLVFHSEAMSQLPLQATNEYVPIGCIERGHGSSEETIVIGPTDTIHDGFLTPPHTYAISVIPTVIPISGSQINKCTVDTQPHQPRNKHRPVFEKGIVNELRQW